MTLALGPGRVVVVLAGLAVVGGEVAGVVEVVQEAVKVVNVLLEARGGSVLLLAAAGGAAAGCSSSDPELCEPSFSAFGSGSMFKAF